LAGKHIEKEHQLDLERERAKILEAREMSVARFRQQIERENDEHAWQQKQTRAPVENQMELDKQRSQLDFDASTLGKRTAILRAETQAKHIPDPNDSLRAEALQLQVDEAKANAVTAKEKREAEKTIRDLTQRAIDAENSGDQAAADQLWRQVGDQKEIHGFQRTEQISAEKQLDAYLSKESKLLTLLGQATRESDRKGIQANLENVQQKIATLTERASAAKRGRGAPGGGNGGAGQGRATATRAEVEAAAEKYGRTVDYMDRYLQGQGVQIVDDGNAVQSPTAPAAPKESPKPQEPPKPKTPSLSAKEMAAKIEAGQEERQREWEKGEPERIAAVKAEKEGYRVQRVIRLARNGNKGALAELEVLARNGNEDAQKELKRLTRKQQSEWNGPSK
jgi:hypothetical protein